MSTQPTKVRQFHIGAQNDQWWIISGEAPASTSDYPRHDADRTCVAKVVDEAECRRLVETAAERDRLREAVTELEGRLSNAMLRLHVLTVHELTA